MSSSSSSDISDEYLYGEMNHPTPWPMQPLIYYTHVPNRPKQRSKERKKQHSNCFAKAFRWYTQERNPYQKANSNTKNAPDVRGFAMWLDEKYTEYLQESRTRGTLKQTSSAEMDEVSNNLNACESCSTKRKFKVLKSPRKRHRRLTNSKDRGTVVIRSNKSFEVILQPKNISRAASEIPRQVSRCTNSTATIVKAKSQSLTSVFVEKEVYSFPYDTVHTDNDDKTTKKRAMSNSIYNDFSTVTRTNTPQPKQQRTRKENVSCQCIQIQPLKQLDQKLSPCNVNVCSDPLQKCPPPCLRNTRNDVETKTMSAECANDATQTSDYPINLTTGQHPLLMKIICPDKKETI